MGGNKEQIPSISGQAEVFEFGVIVEQRRTGKTVIGTYKAGGESNVPIVFWGANNQHPDYREGLIGANNVAPQIIATKRNIIIGGGLMGYREEATGKGIEKVEVPLPSEFEDFIWEQEMLHGGGLEDLANDLLKHGNYFVEYSRKGGGKPATLKPHEARCVRAEKQNRKGQIDRWWLYGQWNTIDDIQRLEEVRDLQFIPNYRPGRQQQAKFLFRGADRLLGGPYYYHPHYEGSLNWLEVANKIPTWHNGNIDNGMAPRFLVKVPHDYYYRTLPSDQQKDKAKLPTYLQAAKKAFKERLNAFFAGQKNAGRAMILTKHMARNLQVELPGVEIEPIEFDLKDQAMLPLYESSNTATTSAHGTPPVLAGIATGAKMTSGSEVRNLYNFYQISAAPAPRRHLLVPYKIAWRDFGFHQEFPGVKLGFRNIEMQTTDKSPTGKAEGLTEETPSE